jgi:eukaryotic-like serine/threonine-protein kinase
MDANFWRKANSLFEAALEKAPPERSAYLSTVCAGDTELLQAVQDLLCSFELATGFFDRMEEELSGAMADAQADPLRVGTLVGDYEIVERIAAGGMAVVYRARRHNRDFEQEVALKVLKRGLDTADLLRRFRAEKQILARLQHPDIAHLYDGGMTAEGMPFFVMELIQGQPLGDYARSHHLTLPQRIELFLRICRAVQFAHRNLIIHRDLKPTNVLITADGTPKLLDFGIAKLLNPEEEAASALITQPENRLLTPDYAAPEQIDDRVITTSTDQYQLGLMLYELLTERHPFELRQKSLTERRMIILQQPPSAPSTQVTNSRLARQLRGDLDTIILTALRKEPERRYESVGQLAEDLEAYLAERPVRAQPDTYRYRLRKFYQRNRIPVLGSALAIFMLALLTTVYTMALTRERDRAQAEAEKASRTAEFMQSLFYQANELTQQGEALSADELLSLGLERLDTMQADPALKGYLYQAIGLTYMGMGLEESAEGPLKRALALRPPGEAPTQAASDAYLTLGSIYMAQGEIPRADSLLSLAWEITQQLPQSAYSSDINLLVSLAEINLHQEQYEAAEDFAQQAEARALARNDTLSHYYANVLFAKGYLYMEQGKLDQAIAAMQEMRQLALDQSNGAPTPLLAGSSHNLAETLMRAGRIYEAQQREAEAIAAWRAAVGPPSSFFLEMLKTKASIEQQLESFDEALNTLNEVRRISLDLYGEDLPPRYGATLLDMAEAFREMGQYDSARYYAEAGLKVEVNQLGPNHSEVGISLGSLGLILTNLKQWAEAKAQFDRGREILVENFGKDHWHVAVLDHNFSFWLEAKGEIDSALTLLPQVAEIHAQTFGPEKLFAIQALRRAGNLARSHARMDLATQWLETALERTRSADQFQKLRLRSRLLGDLAELYQAEGKVQQAAAMRQEQTALLAELEMMGKIE